VIAYSDDMGSVNEQMLSGFFVGWPRQPSPTQHLAVLRGSYRAVVALDSSAASDSSAESGPSAGRVVGFVNMISDGVLTAFIPWLEVLPSYQGQGIGGELMRRIVEGTEHLYSVDLVCDAELVPYYHRLGWTGGSSAMIRHHGALGGLPEGSHQTRRSCRRRTSGCDARRGMRDRTHGAYRHLPAPHCAATAVA
jgi:GNAT superfamily N-acetyltransferase